MIIASIWVAFFQECQQQSCGQVKEGFRLSGGSDGGGTGKFGWLAAWCGPHCDGEAEGTPLMSNYITPGANARADVWMLPMRKPVIQDGRLRMGYW